MPVTSNVLKERLFLTGTSPLVLDNIEHTDPEDPIAIEIKKITNKSSPTREDMQRKNWLQWHARLYTAPGPDGSTRLVFPTFSIVRSVEEAGKAYRLGSKVSAGVSAPDLNVPLIYDGPDDIEQLHADKQFTWRTMVNGNPSSGKKAMVPTERPIFRTWAIELDLIVFNDILGEEDFLRCLRTAGEGKGIGNARKLGYGRFTAEVTRL